ncbi:alpha/beta fold hydrolase [Paludibaculum fermentans]|uniref:alpha/beta fold hydrolase n=1 Tax=Paludibaculum fermentans TaxID=1473598 RepID=UPI003EB7EBAA
MLLTTFAVAMLAAVPAFHVDVVAPGAEKPKMILIPGLQSAGAVWDTTVAHYKDRYECHVLTLAGFAGQPPLPESAPLLQTVRDQLAAYIREKKLTKPVIVGHSLGGFLALWLAESDPDLTGPIVIVDSLPFLPAAWMPGATVESMKPQADQMRGMIAGTKGEAWVNYQKHNPALDTMISGDEGKAKAMEWGIQSDPGTVARGMAELFQTDLRADVSKAKVPALVLAALKGYPESAVKNYETQYSALPGARIVRYPDSKHFIMFDQPAKMMEAMDEFLKGTK